MLRLALPLIIAEIGWMLMGIVDTIMVGRLPDSAQAIGAVSLGSVIFYAIGLIGAGLLLGLDTFISQSFGAGDIPDCNRSLINGVFMAIGLAPVLCALIAGFTALMPRLGITPDVLSLAIHYLNTLNYSLPPLLFYFAFRRYLQGVNLVKPVTFALVSANLVNLAGNYVFVYGHWGAPHLGITGSAWSTVVARAYMALCLFIAIVHFDRKHHTGLFAHKWRPDAERMAELFRLGVPAAGQMFFEIGVFATTAALIATLDAVSLAAHQVALNTAALTFMMPLGVSSAAAVRVGNALGRNDRQAAYRAGWAALVLGASIMGCAAIVLFTAPAWIARLYSPDPAVIALSVKLLYIAAIFQLFDGLQVVATGALRGAGNTRTPMLASTVAYWVIGLPLGCALCFHYHWGAPGLWVGLCAGLTSMGIFLLFLWRRTASAWLPPTASSLYHASSNQL
jgi:MATE family multidrug resistance protein